MRHHIRTGWLIDGSGGPIRKHQLLVVESGYITDITDDNMAVRGPAETVTDLSHCVILPVLIDSHVHLCMSGTIDQKFRDRQLQAGYEELIPLIAEHLRHHFSHGILAVRDGGDRLGSVLRYLSEQHDPAVNPVTVISPGSAHHQQGRYGSLIGVSPEESGSLTQAFTKLGQGTKLVKVVNSGLNSMTEFGRQTPPQFSAAELDGLVAKAKRQGCSVMVHANGEAPVRMAIEAGCDSIEHGFFMGRDNIDLMAEKGIFWVPTMYTMKAYAQNREYYRSAIAKHVVEKTLAHQLEQVAYARERGVRVTLGSDSGSIGVLHGESLVEEMKLFMQAGFTLSETVRSATRYGASLLGLEELGELAPGKPAHFLATRGTPAQLPRKLSYLETIYLDGRPSPLYRRTPDYTTLRKYEGVDFGGKVRY